MVTTTIQAQLLTRSMRHARVEARMIIEDLRHYYSANRPHSAHGELTPTEFALQWTTTHQPQVA